MRDKIFKCISEELNVSINELEPYTSMDELSADIVDTINIIMCIEEIFDIDIDDSEADKLINIQDIIDLVEDKII